ncbi:MAG TPA: hypothetical protein EYO18_01775, partial [Candidatus Marinimicrobia bacterium]|nr:hypothetical protein [Candidatus Neomarinimicrobiota bacterium]
NIDYETIHSQNGSSTQSEIVMEITDDSPTEEKGTLTVSVLITNVNESPTWGNTSIGATADEGIPYQSSAITWGDVDLGDSHELSSDDLPDWLILDVNKKLTGTPSTADVNPSTSFTLKLQDQGGLEITKYLTIDVRGNEAPGFNGSLNDTWEEEISDSWTITFTDENNVDSGTLTATLSSELELGFTQNGMSGIVSGKLPHSYVDQDVTFEITLNDGRNGNPLETTETFTISVDSNDAPYFTNTDDIIQLIHHGCQYNYDVNWYDPDGDNVEFVGNESIGWLNVNNSSGVLSGTPAEINIGDIGSVLLTITDDRSNASESTDYTFTISVDQNYAPQFGNTEDVDSTATVGEEYSFQFGISDENSDDFVFTVPTRPSWLYYNSSNYTISGTPSSADTTHNVTVKAADCGEVTSFSFSIEVTD